VLAAAMSFLAMDPPGHDQLRGIVQTAFSPPRIRKMEDWIRGHAREVVSGLAPLGEADIVTNLAKLLPGLVYAHYIGVASPHHRARDRLLAPRARPSSRTEGLAAGGLRGSDRSGRRGADALAPAAPPLPPHRHRRLRARREDHQGGRQSRALVRVGELRRRRV